jgi:DNA polymerase III delta prime subunit
MSQVAHSTQSIQLLNMVFVRVVSNRAGVFCVATHFAKAGKIPHKGVKIMSDSEELNDILEENVCDEVGDETPCDPEPCEEVESKIVQSFDRCQYSQKSKTEFAPCGPTVTHLVPSVYRPYISNQIGLVFAQVPVKTENLIEFPDSTSKEVMDEIVKFWEREHLFKKFGLSYKRGILLWGPPGSGKSSTIQLVIRDVIERKGVVFIFDHPATFITAFTTFRSIQPDSPAVVIMEDIDEIIKRYGEDEVLQVLDGVWKVDKTIFLATTNYPQKLKARVVNRPSRFDKRFKIGFPNAECRKVYLENVREGVEIDVDKWVEDTEDFSFAHLKELFVATEIIGDDYEDALETLRSMKQRVASDDKEEFESKSLGFLDAAEERKRKRKNRRPSFINASDEDDLEEEKARDEEIARVKKQLSETPTDPNQTFGN